MQGCQSLNCRSGVCKFGIFLILCNHDQHMTLKEPPFFAEAMSSTIVLGPLGKFSQIVSLQPFHDYDLEHDDTS